MLAGIPRPDGSASLPRRHEPRFESNLAVMLEHGTGIARNVSASGIYFETDVPFSRGADLKFTVRFAPSEGGRVKMQCWGRVVRIENFKELFGVAAKLDEFNFEREKG